MKHQITSLVLLSMLGACSKKIPVTKSKPIQYVEVEKIFRVQKSMLGKFSGRAHKLLNNDFIVEATVPGEVAKGIQIGSEVNVTLPLINMGVQKAKVVRNEKEKISVTLKNQIHDLSDQDIEVQLPLKNTTMYEIPFSSIYSPMGGEAYVFTVETNSVSKKEVNVIQVVGDAKILVMANGLANGDRVVRRGLDNLVEGDTVISEDANEF